MRPSAASSTAPPPPERAAVSALGGGVHSPHQQCWKLRRHRHRPGRRAAAPRRPVDARRRGVRARGRPRAAFWRTAVHFFFDAAGAPRLSPRRRLRERAARRAPEAGPAAGLGPALEPPLFPMIGPCAPTAGLCTLPALRVGALRRVTRRTAERSPKHYGSSSGGRGDGERSSGDPVKPVLSGNCSSSP